VKCSWTRGWASHFFTPGAMWADRLSISSPSPVAGPRWRKTSKAHPGAQTGGRQPWCSHEPAPRGSVHVAAPPLGLEGALVLHVGGVPVDHRPVVPSHQAHQVAF
jgi:hypothetical protein